MLKYLLDFSAKLRPNGYILIDVQQIQNVKHAIVVDVDQFKDQLQLFDLVVIVVKLSKKCEKCRKRYLHIVKASSKVQVKHLAEKWAILPYDVFYIPFKVLLKQHSTLLYRCTNNLFLRGTPPKRHITVINVAANIPGQPVKIA